MKAFALLIFFPLLFICCSAEDAPAVIAPQAPANAIVIRKYLALGDSYTIGESVNETERFPAQLRDSLQRTQPLLQLSVDYIARTGWTTTNLAAAIATQNPSTDYDLVTLLIGVNNQYQHKPFSLYEQEFPQLVQSAINLGRGNKAHVIVVSIPDYAFTPYGNGTGNQAGISAEIDQYNNFAQTYCAAQNVRFVDITDITRNGLADPSLVASDGLHPSRLAYALFASRLRAFAQSLL